MKMDVNVGLPKVAIAAVAIFAVLLVVLLAWLGGEAHYGNCLEKAALEHPVASGSGVRAEVARREGVDSCSRWP